MNDGIQKTDISNVHQSDEAVSYNATNTHFENSNPTKNMVYDENYYFDTYYGNNSMLTSHTWLELSWQKYITTFCWVWSGMIDFIFLQKIRLYFLDEVYHEDHNFGIILFLQSNAIFMLAEYFYIYRKRRDSIIDYGGGGGARVSNYRHICNLL